MLDDEKRINAVYPSVEDMIDDMLVCGWINPPKIRTPYAYKQKLNEMIVHEAKLRIFMDALNVRDMKVQGDGDGI